MIAALLAFVLLALPSLFSLYYVDAWTQVAIYSIVTLGLGLLVGRVGMVSLGQGAVLAMGAWVAARLLFATSLPYPIVLLAAGPDHDGARHARRAARAADERPVPGADHADARRRDHGRAGNINFPNGGHGFTGYNGGSVHIPPIRRPSIATTDPGVLPLLGDRRGRDVPARARRTSAGSPGRAWAAIRQSESAALAAGINTTFYKLWAFALASFVTGVAGGLVAGSFRYLNSLTFATQDSITLLAVVLMGGAYSMWGAIVAAFLLKFLPGAAQRLGRLPRLADDPVRDRRAPGPDDRAARDSSSSSRRTWRGSAG